MKTDLLQTVKVFLLSLSFFFCLASLHAASAKKNVVASNHSSSDTTVLKKMDSVVVDADYTIFILSDTSTLRFHFAIQKINEPLLKSKDIPANFSIGDGFISFYGARKAAEIIILKQKAGIANPDISAEELTQNNINQ